MPHVDAAQSRLVSDLAPSTKGVPYLLKAEMPSPVVPPPRPARSFAQERRRQLSEDRLRNEYERAFPYERSDKPQKSVERVSRRGPEVSGGLPSLGKRRP
jgi:hypothetical protein